MCGCASLAILFEIEILDDDFSQHGLVTDIAPVVFVVITATTSRPPDSLPEI
jgi:hypothetical protein